MGVKRYWEILQGRLWRAPFTPVISFNPGFASFIVFRARILEKRYIGQETRYDVQVKHTYRNHFPIVHREFVWVSNTCDCPLLTEQREYVLMARRHVNYEHTFNRILLQRGSYVRPWSPREDLQLRDVPKHCLQR